MLFSTNWPDFLGPMPAVGDVSAIHISLLNCIIFGSLPLWTSKLQVKEFIPSAFDEYPDTRVILDCTEIWVQRPASLMLNSEFYSHYKDNINTTLKEILTSGDSAT